MYRMTGKPMVLGGLLLGVILMVHPIPAAAQRHGGHGMGGSVSGAPGRPDGVNEKDTLKDFHHALAVQAARAQITEFQEVVKSTNAARDRWTGFAQPGSGRERITPFEQALEGARVATKKFEQGFSEPQKSGLKDTTKRLEKSDSELEQEAQRLGQAIQAESGKDELSARSTSVDKALTEFANLQLALGREMGITLASAEDLAFNLPQISNNAVLANRKISVGNSSTLSQNAVNGNLRSFVLEMTVDLSDLQQKITEVLNAEINQPKPCGERLSVRNANIMAADPASSMVLQLHFERWSCAGTFGQSLPSELGEGDGSVELRLFTKVGEGNVLNVVSESKRIDASGMMGEELRSGDLGTELRERVSDTLQRAIRLGSDLTKNLPGALQNSAALQSARFQDSGTGGLKLVLGGKVQLSNEQLTVLASQLNQNLSAQRGSAP